MLFPTFFSLLPAVALATYPSNFPPEPQGVTVVDSPAGGGVSISYKQADICETTPGVKSYSGYVHLPPNADEARPYNVNLFFWFFEARQNPKNAPLSLWLQGGPGVPSITAALGENGPCLVNNNSIDTTLNPYSWTEVSNMLYIDQPVQVGFSYDSLINGTINEIVNPFLVAPANFSSAPQTNGTVLAGTFPSQQTITAPNTTAVASLAIWHFMQTWTQQFPDYTPPNNKFNIWTESYGGHYGPTYASLFESQNALIANGSLKGTQLSIDTLGLINACIDLPTQMPYYPQMAYNNTYGLQLINQTQFEAALDAVPQCLNITSQCRAAVAACNGPLCDSSLADKACLGAFGFCFKEIWNPYNSTSGRDVFDIAHPTLDPFPPVWAAGYLNTKEVQQALGVPLNFTGNSAAVAENFQNTGDFVRGGNLEAIGSLLDQGVKVALVYGDRDYQCNWLGGEQISLAINSSQTPSFHSAGYANITTNSTYVGGMVRQSGNLSFSRVFQAGHMVSWYQPSTSLAIFNRTIHSLDVATGETLTSSSSQSSSSSPNSTTPYTTSGLSSSFTIKDTPPSAPAPTCYLWDMLQTCTTAEKYAVLTGQAIVKDFVLVGYVNGTSATGGNGTGSGSNGGGQGGNGNGGSAGGAATGAAGSVKRDSRGLGWGAALGAAVGVGMGI